jgi:hypothetical protein
MTLAFQSLLMIVLLISTAVSILPILLREVVPLSPTPLRAGLRQQGLWIVQSFEERWYINGKLTSRRDLERKLQRQPVQAIVHYLPSNALPLESVSRSLRWLRSLAPGAVVLELPPLSSLHQ